MTQTGQEISTSGHFTRIMQKAVSAGTGESTYDFDDETVPL